MADRLHMLFNSPTDDGSFSGGSWNASYPLTNLVDQQPKTKARSSNALNASTLFVVDCGSSQSFQMFAFINPNFSTDSTIRIRVSPNSNGSSPTLDETITGKEANVAWGTLPWGMFPWDGYDSTYDPDAGWMTVYLHSASVAGRYVLIDIDDDGNSDGYVEFGRFMAGVPFVPGVNIWLGAQFGFVDESTLSRSAGGALFVEAKPKRRRLQASLEWLTSAEAMGDVYELQSLKGITKGLLAVVNPEDSDVVKRYRQSIYGTLTGLEPITYKNPIADVPMSWGFTVEELN